MSGEANTVAQPAPPKKKGGPAAAPATAAEVGQPTLSKNQSANKARVAGQAAKKDAVAAQPKAPKAEKVKRNCACGCVDPETNARTQVGGYFAMGHDARYKGWMIKIERGQMAVKDLPPTVQKEVAAAGGWVKTETGYRTVNNYKGEPHAGYAPPVPA